MITTSGPDNLPDAPNLQLRAALIARIQVLLDSNHWTQQEAAGICGQTQPRLSDLRRGTTERFSLDALVNNAAALARHSTTTEGDTMEYTEADGERLVAEFMAQLTAKPVKGRYPAATECSTTERGGVIVAGSGLARRADASRWSATSHATRTVAKPASSPVPARPCVTRGG